MDVSDDGVTAPGAGLISREAGSPTNDPTLAYSDGGRSWFPDVGFPATREQLYASAVGHGAPRRVLDAIRRLPEVVGNAWDVPDLYAMAEERDEVGPDVQAEVR